MLLGEFNSLTGRSGLPRRHWGCLLAMTRGLNFDMSTF